MVCVVRWVKVGCKFEINVCLSIGEKCLNKLSWVRMHTSRSKPASKRERLASAVWEIPSHLGDVPALAQTSTRKWIIQSIDQLTILLTDVLAGEVGNGGL